jgi:hypothetical protein
MTVLENTWTTALGALAYEVSGDATYLTQHARSFLTFPRKMYHAKGDPYDWYGIGPGPLGEGWGLYLAWGRFLRALQDAKITELKLTGTVEGNYLVTPSRYDYAPTPASLTVYGLKSKDGPFTVTYRASSLGGDLHRGQVQVFSPSGKKVMQFEAPPVGGPSSWTEQKEAPADGETGLYRFELRLHAANVRSPVFSLPHEAALAPKGREILTSGCFAVLRPTDETAAVDLTITSPATAGRAANVRLEDGAGATLIEASLFAARDKPTAAITLDPAKHPLPWKLDVVGHVNIKWDGKSDRLFMATSDESLKAVMAALK